MYGKGKLSAQRVSGLFLSLITTLSQLREQSSSMPLFLPQNSKRNLILWVKVNNSLSPGNPRLLATRCPLRVCTQETKGTLTAPCMNSKASKTFSSSYLRPTSCNDTGASTYVAGE